MLHKCSVFAPFVQSASDQIGQGLGSVGAAQEALGTAMTPLGAGTAISKVLVL